MTDAETIKSMLRALLVPITENYARSNHYVKRHYANFSHKTKKIDDLFYEALHSIEDEYGSLANCPEYDERLRFLRTY